MSDYEIGREIARRGNLMNPAASEEIKRGYRDKIGDFAQQVAAWRQTQQSIQAPQNQL
jgi:hypothetical protein